MRAAINQFWEENDIMQNALETAASQVLGPEQARKYVISGTPQPSVVNCVTINNIL